MFSIVELVGHLLLVARILPPPSHSDFVKADAHIHYIVASGEAEVL